MAYQWSSYVVLTALVVSAIGIFMWKKKSKKFVKVGRISKLLFFPVKSLKAVEVSKGKCTKFGFEVDGVLDRTFMLVDEKGILVSQRQEPSLVLLAPSTKDNYLFVNGPNLNTLKIKIKQNISPEDKVIKCKVHGDDIDGVDCGDEAALWFESYLNRKGIHLVQYLPSITTRKSTSKSKFHANIIKKHPVGFQDLVSIHLLSQASVNDLNSKIGEKKISEYNFRPNVLVEECDAFAEDSWEYIKSNEAEMFNVIFTTRCLLTTNDPNTGILSQKEPLVTLRKYRIAKDKKLRDQIGSIPCLGIGCAVLNSGEVKVGDDVYATIKDFPNMEVKM